MSKLENFSDEDLAEELRRRKIEKKLLKQINPLPYNQDEHDKFVEAIKSMIDDEIKGEGKDIEHYVYETTYSYLFGDDVFEKLNSLRNNR